MENSMKNNDEIEIDLRQIFIVILSKIAIILLVGVIFGLAAFIGSKLLLKPVYRSQTSLYALKQCRARGTTTLSDLQSSTQLRQDYMISCKKPYRAVTEKGYPLLSLGLSTTDEKLAKADHSVSTPSDSRVLEITVSNNDQYEAKRIADKVAEISADSICDIMQIEKVNVFEEANIPEKPSSPNCLKNAIIAFVLGMVLAIAIVVVRFVMNDTINTSEDIEKYLGISTLALIPLSEDLDDSAEAAAKRKKRKHSSSKKGDGQTSRVNIEENSES
ncbi:MAG: YveK family protein [Lachnospira sp.]